MCRPDDFPPYDLATDHEIMRGRDPHQFDDLEEDPDAPDDGLVLVAGVLYDAETGDEAEPTCDICDEPMECDRGETCTAHAGDWNGETGCHRSCEERQRQHEPDPDDSANFYARSEHGPDRDPDRAALIEAGRGHLLP